MRRFCRQWPWLTMGHRTVPPPVSSPFVTQVVILRSDAFYRTEESPLSPTLCVGEHIEAKFWNQLVSDAERRRQEGISVPVRQASFLPLVRRGRKEGLYLPRTTIVKLPGIIFGRAR